MGLHSGGLIIGRTFASEIGGGGLIFGKANFFFWGGGGIISILWYVTSYRGAGVCKRCPGERLGTTLVCHQLIMRGQHRFGGMLDGV